MQTSVSSTRPALGTPGGDELAAAPTATAAASGATVGQPTHNGAGSSAGGSCWGGVGSHFVMPADLLWALSLCCEWLMSQQPLVRRLPQGRPGLVGVEGVSSACEAKPGKLSATVLRPLMRQRWRSAVSPTEVANTKSASKALSKR